MESLFTQIAFLNNSKVLAGLSIILMNMGSRHVISDLGIVHNKILSSEIFKKIIVFSMFFVATRDVITAFMLTISYIFVVDGILHEKRNFCIVPKRFLTQPPVSEEEYMRAKYIISKYETEKKTTATSQEFKDPSLTLDEMNNNSNSNSNSNSNIYDNYKKNLMFLQNTIIN
jgi:hypothetical protein